MATTVQPFADRREAGRELGERVAALGLSRPVVLALPRGGVPVAAEVAARLGAELDVLVARKLGAPRQPELGVGAVAEGGEPVIDDRMVLAAGLSPEDLEVVVRRERAELARRVRVYRGHRPPTTVADRDAVLVDDGLATGGTARAALRALATAGARRRVLAVPVAPPETAEAMRAEAEDVIVLRLPESFRAVGRWYKRFPQLRDDEVIALLVAAQAPRR